MGKRKLRLKEDRAFTPAETLAAATPRKFIESFDEYLGSGLKEDETKPWGFDDIVEFIRTDIFMRHHTCSAAELQMYRMPDDSIKQFRVVRKALSKADIPPHKRKAVDGGARLPYKTFDPLIMTGVKALNEEWSSHNFVLCITWGDMDDDKIPNCSPLWPDYGCRQTPTKDKKLKPVIHLMASVSTGYLIWMCPDTLQTTQSDMVDQLLNQVDGPRCILLKLQLGTILLFDVGKFRLERMRKKRWKKFQRKMDIDEQGRVRPIHLVSSHKSAVLTVVMMMMMMMMMTVQCGKYSLLQELKGVPSLPHRSVGAYGQL